MEQLLKLIRKNSFITISAFVLFFMSCQATHKTSKTYEKQRIVINDTINKSGYLIFDSKKGIAFFLENLSYFPSSEYQIKSKIKESKYLVILRKGLNTYITSDYLTLSLCAHDDRFVVNMKKLYFNRYGIIKLNDFNFYKIDRKYKDQKERLIICEGE